MLRRIVPLVLLVLTACPKRSRYREHMEAQNAAEKGRVSKITDVGLKFIFFDLGQADAMLMLYQGKTLLIDAGAARDSDDAQKVHHIAKTLEALTGKKHLDAFMVTHYHFDHTGNVRDSNGLYAVVDDGVTIDTFLDRGDVLYGSGDPDKVQASYTKAVGEWIASGKSKARRTVKLGEKLDFGEGLTVEVVAVNGNGFFEKLMQEKPDDLSEYPASENDYSVALKFTYGDFEFFTGGDLTGQTKHNEFRGVKGDGYHDVESNTAGRVGDVEVYRVNHHGSRYSSNGCFIKVLHPEVSIFSCGENSYGHPHPKVYDPLADMGRVYITGGADPKQLEHVAR